ncbi:nucleotidyltransferase family protein [Echinicola strongylocentroti]|uniref:Nucleotidyltransferase family protein n=1 Tax=Echinicola strongylocentroti TaxID=1795355 RepID=A0A2Z4IG31_9BACT|nr:nucleotidyltransferase family protein [Echinicola strongylocentroti]AWW29669.1 nucleotidyltransferase family protein [Echinicola strongylocentroti]
MNKPNKKSYAVNTGKYGIIVLAAGNSTRLGRDKQTLLVQGETLLKRASKTAVAAQPDQVVVVLGEKAHLHQRELHGLEVSIVINSDSSEGIASSIRTGIRHLQSLDQDIDYALIMLCDQPYVTSGHLKAIIDRQHETKARIVASRYQKRAGVPVLFHKRFFSSLLKLKGDSGAKQFLLEAEDLITVELLNGEVDIDTMEDYLRLQISNS